MPLVDELGCDHSQCVAIFSLSPSDGERAGVRGFFDCIITYRRRQEETVCDKFQVNVRFRASLRCRACLDDVGGRLESHRLD